MLIGQIFPLSNRAPSVAAPSTFSGAAAIEAQRLDDTGACEYAGFHQQETGIEWTHQNGGFSQEKDWFIVNKAKTDLW